MLDDPEIERSRDVLGVLEPVLELSEAFDVTLVIDVGEKVDALLDLVLGVQQDEAADHRLAGQHAPMGGDKGLVEAEVSAWREGLEHGQDGRVSSVEVDRGSGDGERVDSLGGEGGVDRCQPSTLAIADEVDRAADPVDAIVDDVEVVLDRRVRGLLGGSDPIQRVQAGQTGLANAADLALRRAEIHDGRIVARLWRKHQSGDDVAG